MDKVSILIPARNEIWLAKTVEDVLSKATGDVEVVVVLDGYWPNPPLKEDKRVIILHRSESHGLRDSVNSAVSIATGKYIMKIDAHCMFAEGFDKELKEHFEDNWIVTPSRYSLDADKWERGYGPLEYLYLTYPYIPDSQYGEGLHGRKWLGKSGIENSRRPAVYYYLERERIDKKIDDIQAFQGSCWFMNRQKFLDIGGFDERFGTFFQEPQEIAFKVWLTGGRIVVNKYTWYCHWHKDISGGYGFSNRRKHASFNYSSWYWMNDKWPLATRKMEEFIQFHWPIPGWPENWKKEKEIFEKNHPNEYNSKVPKL